MLIFSVLLGTWDVIKSMERNQTKNFNTLLFHPRIRVHIYIYIYNNNKIIVIIVITPKGVFNCPVLSLFFNGYRFEYS